MSEASLKVSRSYEWLRRADESRKRGVEALLGLSILAREVNTFEEGADKEEGKERKGTEREDNRDMKGPKKSFFLMYVYRRNRKEKEKRAVVSATSRVLLHLSGP